MQEAAILAQNPDAKIYTLSSSAHQGLTEVLRALREVVVNSAPATAEPVAEPESDIPVITLDVKEQKRRAHHQKYQLGERNAILELGADEEESDDSDDIDE